MLKVLVEVLVRPGKSVKRIENCNSVLDTCLWSFLENHYLCISDIFRHDTDGIATVI